MNSEGNGANIGLYGSTHVGRESNPVFGVTLAPSPAVKSQGADHRRAIRRLFIGPMPEKAISPSNSANTGMLWKASQSKTSIASSFREPGNEDEISVHHAFRFFLMQGGREEDWGEEEEGRIRQEMLRKWKESKWGVKEPGGKNKWVGQTFEVGKDVLGIMDHEEALSMRAPSTSASAAISLVQVNEDLLANPRSSTFRVSWKNHDDSGSTSKGDGDHGSTSALPLLNGAGPSQPADDTQSATAAPSTSRTDGLLPKEIRSALKKTRTGSLRVDKGKGKTVQLPDSLQERAFRAAADDADSTAPPSEVLARSGSDLDDTTAGAVEDAMSKLIHWGDVVLRDRMLIRIGHIPTGGLPRYLDEKSIRTISVPIQHEDWAEFMVVWRKDRLEIYEDFHTPGKEWFMGHKKLAFVVPLNKTKTRLSVYSHTDMTFCISCPPTPAQEYSKGRTIFHRSPTGMNIFVFKNKSRTRAVDWIWNLWRELGGQLPDTIDIKCPTLEATVTCPIPSEALGGGEGFATLTRSLLIDLCKKQLSVLPGWEVVFEEQLQKGAELELCWRNEMTLDWVWLEDDVEGKKRDWEVLYGLALKRPHTPNTLEIRLAEHTATRVSLKDGTRLDEPPSLEGYLHRIKPKTQIRTPVYLTTHDGNLFSIPTSDALPPHPPVAPHTIPEDGSPGAPPTRDAEVRRGAGQILQADGFIDMRSIIAVRRAFQLSPIIGPVAQAQINSSGNIPGVNSDLDDALTIQEEMQEDSDDEDDGGDEYLSTVSDKTRLKMKRSFELLMRSGHVIRLEAHSRKVALEWINGLRALVSYWTRRHRVDARQEMDLIHAVTGHKSMVATKLHPENDFPEGPPDPNKSAPYLGHFWQWCTLHGCRSISRAGRLFVRFGVRGQYKHMFQVLAAGHLILFQLKPDGPGHHAHKRTINLLDAYVTSSHLAAQALPRDEYNAPITPRRYQDGLVADDSEEDITVVIWYRPHLTTAEEKQATSATHTIHELGSRNKYLVLKCRSKLEKDAWCWALNCEIEKVVRASREREQIARETGELIKVSKEPRRNIEASF